MGRASMRERVDGRRITDRELRAGLRVNILAGSLGMAWAAVTTGIAFTMLLEALGASGRVFGLFGLIGSLSMAMQIPGALFAERLPERKRFWFATAFVHRLLWFVPALLPLWLPPGPLLMGVLLAALGLSAVLAQIATASWFSWLADLVPEEGRGRFWGSRQTFTMAAFFAATLLSGWALDRFPDPRAGGSFEGFAWVLAAAALLGIIDILVHLRVPEPRPRPSPARAGLRERLLAPLQVPDFRRLTLAMAAWSFGLGAMGAFGMVYLKRTFEVSYTDLAIWSLAGTLGAAASGRLWGGVIDRVGARTFGALMLLAAPLFILPWFFLRPGTFQLGPFALPLPVAILTAGALFAGGLYSGVGLAQFNLLGIHAPREGRTVAMAVHWTVFGAAGAVGSVLGGLLMDAWPALEARAGGPLARLPSGLPLSFFHPILLLHFLSAYAAALPLLLRIAPRRDLAVGDALRRILILNPFRAATSMYNIHLLGSAGSRLETARAARELGEQRTALAVSDLIARLDDPASEVREEAALALGRIGSPDALDALAAKLADPHSDLAPQIARAVRASPDPRLVDALVGCLRDGDPSTRSEAARTLGVIGDRRATASLLDLLRGARDERTAIASGEALARLGEMAAIYELLPRLRATRNPILRRTLAVSIGDLLGAERGEFYRLYTQEQAERGRGVEELCDRLASAIRRAARGQLLVPGEALVARVAEVRLAYELRQSDACVDRLFDLAIGLGALMYGVRFGGNAEVFIEDLIFRDERFAVGVWMLHLLREESQDAPADFGPDEVEALLGIFFLAGQRLDGAARPQSPPA